MSELSLILIFIGVCVIYFFVDKYRKKNRIQDNPIQKEEKEEKKVVPDGCCGAHAVCEKESLLNKKIEVEYYDDEELDVLSCRSVDTYTEEELNQISEVFYSLQEKDVAGWLRSLQLRAIELPETIKDEALLIVKERRYRL